ncbi:ArgP/LysG family DNA-binding transcriptional regulator [Acinetobacter sp. ANC 5054]|uniref:LysR family transcriptional regulator ArgP n=1 Tax=Acinetobacter sp. ANC 5054 TaxID=1977877 RepID=UPI000A32DE49|nr:LysR family transcriptional regulator ArgP [Acinetobacter sp. ANC 5054]OTG83464.1 ArgP/LysG family DNA-binding transcriptional regulator [Acinetobacter sp. ANC 5054]
MLQSKHSEAFLAVAETGSFEQAAIRLNITASAVTLRLQTLEKNLGHVLIVRERPCRVTQAGQSLLHYLQHSKLLEQNFMQNLTGQTENSFYQINIATNADSLATWLLPLLKDILIEEKFVIHFHVDDQSQTHHLLEAGLVNACVATESKSMKGCIADYLGTMHYRFVATPQFIQQWFSDGLTREALRSAPAVIFNEKDQMHMHSISKIFGLNPSQYPHHFIPSSTAFVDAITMGLGYGWLPDFQNQKFLNDGTLIEVSQALSIDLPFYWHHWKQQSEPLEKLTALLQHHAKSYMDLI